MAKKEQKSKTADVLKYLSTHKKGITPDIAKEKFHVGRLASIIYTLKKRGYNIETIKEVGTDAYGKNEYARYILKKND